MVIHWENWKSVRQQREWFYASVKLSVSGYHRNCFTFGPEFTENTETVTGNSYPFSCRDEAKIICEMFWLSSALKILRSRAGTVLAYHKKRFSIFLFIGTWDAYHFLHWMTHNLGNTANVSIPLLLNSQKNYTQFCVMKLHGKFGGSCCLRPSCENVDTSWRWKRAIYNICIFKQLFLSSQQELVQLLLWLRTSS